MTLKDFRKLLQGCDPDAEVVFQTQIGVDYSEVFVVEGNATDETGSHEPVVWLNIHTVKKETHDVKKS